MSSESLRNQDENHQAREALRQDAIAGLSGERKTLPSKHLYDERGSILFDDICELDDYYPTRTEISIMRNNIDQITNAIGTECALIEYGSGSSLKTKLLLKELEDLKVYVPIDIAAEHLEKAAVSLKEEFPDVSIVPVCADFSETVDLPEEKIEDARRVVYFPGSTIGNLTKDLAAQLLSRMADDCGDNGAVLIGVDLHKDRAILERAYNDSEGVTADFNLNLLRRLNRELDADFELEQFEHKAIYVEEEKRIEMHLVSQEQQAVQLDGVSIEFEEGESILTEYSHKYSLEGFANLARKANLEVRNVWTDDNDLFSVQLLTPGS